MKLGIWKYILGGLVLAAIAVWLGVSKTSDDRLHIIACDVGQGDGILIVKGSTQILIDGGPNDRILDCLGKYIPYFDKKIEAVLVTHPQLDHYGGIVDVLQNYQVETLLANGLDSTNVSYSELKNQVQKTGVKVIAPSDQISLRYGSLYLDIVHPTEKFLTQNSTVVESGSGDILGSYTSSVDPNEFSIVAILSFGEFDALFSGDISGGATSEILAGGQLRDVEYLKVPHHGSKNGLTLEFLKAVTPEIAVISAGKNNSYDHPHAEILNMLTASGIEIFRTDEAGDIEIITDGDSWWFEKI